jgi:hypothetical protein
MEWQTQGVTDLKYLVEEMLSSRFLLELGIYLQTCAHIELAVWQIILEARGVSTTAATVPVAHVVTKLNTERLRKELRTAATLVHAPLGLRIHALSNEIDDGVLNRNAAAHGAFHTDHIAGSLHVAHFFAVGKGRARQFFSIEEPVLQEVIDEAMDTADRLLREAVDIRTKLQGR